MASGCGSGQVSLPSPVFPDYPGCWSASPHSLGWGFWGSARLSSLRVPVPELVQPPPGPPWLRCSCARGHEASPGGSHLRRTHPGKESQVFCTTRPRIYPRHLFHTPTPSTQVGQEAGTQTCIHIFILFGHSAQDKESSYMYNGQKQTKRRIFCDT